LLNARRILGFEGIGLLQKVIDKPRFAFREKHATGYRDATGR
jgi:hypothetical protein